MTPFLFLKVMMLLYPVKANSATYQSTNCENATHG